MRLPFVPPGFVREFQRSNTSLALAVADQQNGRKAGNQPEFLNLLVAPACGALHSGKDQELLGGAPNHVASG